jgi:hypothetical protein
MTVVLLKQIFIYITKQKKRLFSPVFSNHFLDIDPLDLIVQPRLELLVLEHLSADVSQLEHVVRVVVVRVVHETLVIGL